MVLGFAACATLSPREQEVQVAPSVLSNYLADKPEALREHYSMVMVQGPRNEVLNQMRSGLAAYELGAMPVATESFDRALQSIEAVYADNPDAAKARELFTRESYKDFKGEPYERAMAYYYRGLLYMREGDYQNARASFKGGILQDAFAEEEQNRADFALLIFLEGWASHCAGDPSLARESFAELTKLKPDFVLPGDGHNTVVLVETGSAPVKFADGTKREFLRYRRGDGVDEPRVDIEIDSGEARTAYSMEDIFFQASTRGGRPIDYILAGKVNFKEGTETAGRVLKTVGFATMAAGLSSRNNYATLAGGAVTIFGLVADGIAAAVRPEADARYWDNLPDKVHVLSLALDPGPHAVQARVLDGSANPIEGLVRTAALDVSGKCALAWLRSRTALPTDVRAPGTITQPK